MYISPFILLQMTERKAQVAPAELENLVRSLDGVADCAVLGIPHPRAGQVWLFTDKDLFLDISNVANIVFSRYLEQLS